jgi:sigma-B regulation protein RsbU (phosphoserine phosphatase)
MASINETFVRPQLLDRRRRLATALAVAPAAPELDRLLTEVDAALERMERGTYGLCDICHDPVEPERLLADPLLRMCLDHLTQEEQRALEHDLEAAARIQRGLLPDANIAADGWEFHYRYLPAGVVSGDYCDLVQPQGREGDLFFLFGDVSGKGVSAAILMSHLHAIFRSLVSVQRAPDRLVAEANRLFRETTLAPYFATLVCGRASREGAIELCNAGHCPPIVLARDGIRTVAPTGFPVGVFASDSYRTTRLELCQGESLVLYTDGISEARSPGDEEYGVERLHRVLAEKRDLTAKLISSACLADLASFLDHAPRTDDVTLMVLRRIA